MASDKSHDDRLRGVNAIVEDTGGFELHPMTRQELLRRAAFGGLAVAGFASASGYVARSAAGRTFVPRPRAGGQLNFVMNSEPSTLDPHLGPFIADNSIINLVAETLLTVDSKYNLHPGLARSFALLQGGRVIDLRLRPGVTFSDGSPFNANAVKINLDRIVAPATASLTGSVLLAQYQGTQVLDDLHARIHMKTPWAPALIGLAIGWAGMLSPRALKEMGKDIGTHPVGTGPYTFVNWVRQSHITLKKRPDYKGGGPPYRHSGPAYLDQITFAFATDDSTRTGLIESGQADVVYGVPYADVNQLKSSGHVVIEGLAVGGPLVTFVNVKKAPGNDPALRKALPLAVNRDALVKAAFFGHSVAEYGLLSHGTLGFDSSLSRKYAYNPGKANQILDAAGWQKGSDGTRSKNGVKAEFTHSVTFLNQSIAQLFQAQMQAIGVKVNLQNMEIAAATDAQTKGTTDMFTDVFKAAIDPHIAVGGWLGKTSATNWAHYTTPQLESQINAAAQTSNKTVRAARYRAIQEEVLASGVGLPIANPVDLWNIKSGVYGTKLWLASAVMELYDAYKA